MPLIAGLIVFLLSGYIFRRYHVEHKLTFLVLWGVSAFGLALAWFNADETTGYCGFTVPNDLRGIEAVHTVAQCNTGHAGEGTGLILFIGCALLALSLIRRNRVPWAGHGRREPIPFYIRDLVRVRDNNLCRGCGLPGTPDDPLEFDHIWPVSRGGGNNLDNIQLLHKSENMTKGARVP